MKRKVGRPRLGKGATIALTVRLPAEVHRRLTAESRRRGMPLAELAREKLSADPAHTAPGDGRV